MDCIITDFHCIILEMAKPSAQKIRYFGTSRLQAPVQGTCEDERGGQSVQGQLRMRLELIQGKSQGRKETTQTGTEFGTNLNPKTFSFRKRD